MKAEIIAVGSELLTPDRLDTNSLFLTEELNAIGIEVVRKTVVGDNRELLAEAFRDALNRVPLIIASGGLGPTEDDLTRETVADLLGRKLRRNNDILRYIEGRFRSLGREMPEVNVRQARKYWRIRAGPPPDYGWKTAAAPSCFCRVHLAS